MPNIIYLYQLISFMLLLFKTYWNYKQIYARPWNSGKTETPNKGEIF